MVEAFRELRPAFRKVVTNRCCSLTDDNRNIKKKKTQNLASGNLKPEMMMIFSDDIYP